MTQEDAKEFIDGRFVTAWDTYDSSPVLVPIEDFPGGSMVDVDLELDFSALQLLGDSRRTLVRRTGLERLFSSNTERVTLLPDGTTLFVPSVPSVVQSKWGGVLTYTTRASGMRVRNVRSTIRHVQMYGGNVQTLSKWSNELVSRQAPPVIRLADMDMGIDMGIDTVMAFEFTMREFMWEFNRATPVR